MDNKSIVRAFAKAADDISAGKAEWTLQQNMVTEDFRVHTAGSAEPLDFAAFRRFSGELMAGFPGFHHRFEDQIAEGDRVANRITLACKHDGVFEGIAPTHKTVEMTIYNIMRIADGKIAEIWRISDMEGLLRQING